MCTRRPRGLLPTTETNAAYSLRTTVSMTHAHGQWSRTGPRQAVLARRHSNEQHIAPGLHRLRDQRSQTTLLHYKPLKPLLDATP